jgi:acetyl esterase/lipase
MRWHELLDPEVAAVLDRIPLLDLTDIPTARAERAELAVAARARWQPSGRVCAEDRSVPGPAGAPDVRVRVHRPADGTASGAALLWVHGGGHVLGAAEQDDPLLDGVVSRTGCTAVAVDWRRAPEHPYPAALEDCYAALTALAADAALGDLGVDPARIVVAGSSSGGGIAAGLVLLARDRAEHRIAAQLLIYPMLDDRGLTGSSRAVTDHRVWNDESNRLGWAAYLGALSADDVPAYAAPARAADLRGLPATWIGTGELDLFRDEDVDYARRLYAAGVPTDLHVYAGAVHGFDLFAPGAAVTRRFCRERDEAFDRFLLG